MSQKSCGSCLMPFSKDTGVRESEKYCSHCFKNGALCYEGNNVQEFQKRAYESMLEGGTNTYLAKFYTWMIQFAPRWRK